MEMPVFNNLVDTSHRLAKLYRYQNTLPCHLLQAMSSQEGVQECLEDAGYDCQSLRTHLVSGFREASFSSQAGEYKESSEEFASLLDMIRKSCPMKGVKTFASQVVSVFCEFDHLDSLSRYALNEAKRLETVAIEDDLDAILKSAFEEDASQAALFEKGQEQSGGTSTQGLPPSFSEDAIPGEPRRSSSKEAARARGKHQGSKPDPKSKQTKEREESLAAVSDARVDLSELAAAGELDLVFGRDAEIARIVEILMRRRKPNVLLVGEPGVGKSAIIDGLAQFLISEGENYGALSQRPVQSVDLSKMVAGTRYRGDFESRMSILIEQAQDQNAILFFDEIHMLMGAGVSGNTGMDGGNILKPALARGGMSVIGATTIQEAKILRQDKALMRRFEVIYLEEPSFEDMEKILAACSCQFLLHHEATILPDVQGQLLRAAHTFLPERRDPDRCFDLLDLAGVACRMRGDDMINGNDIYQALLRMGAKLPEKVLPGAREGIFLNEIQTKLVSGMPGHEKAMDVLARRLSKKWNSNASSELIILQGPENSGKARAATLAASLKKRRLQQLSAWSVAGGLSQEHLEQKIGYIAEADPEAVVSIRVSAEDVTTKATIGSFIQKPHQLAGSDTPVNLDKMTFFLLVDGLAEKAPKGVGFGIQKDNNQEVQIFLPKLFGTHVDLACQHVISEIILSYQDLGIHLPEDEMRLMVASEVDPSSVLLEELYEITNNCAQNLSEEMALEA
jgi:hypothetical protein